jgi:16S rRNA (adenine1518-N6/adenine1519-N6)-dimethyltransferase
VIGAAARECDLIIEIGAGPGALTGRLLDLGRMVVAIEIDARLAAALRARFAESPRLEVLEGDILEIDLAQLIRSRSAGKAVVAGNLPYYITSPILHRVFDAAGSIRHAFFLMQKEVAARVTAWPGTPDFGYLSVLCQAYSVPRLLFSVPPGAFRPPPKVTSALVHFDMQRRFEQWGVTNPRAFLKFVQLCFRQKRKTLLNNLEGRFGRERVAGLPEARLRAEQLAPEQLAALWLRLSNNRESD